MAIFALVGGALLFTHVHSGAAYANVAVGVYVHHTIMGLVALGIGGAKLLEDALPHEHSLRLRGFRWLYPGLMALEAGLLINYNEGLPWFIGYGDMRVSAPHNGLLAHFGTAERAELCFDRTTGRIDVYLLRRFEDAPANITSDYLQGIATVGMETTLISLAAAPDAPAHSHFTGQAAFLNSVPLFQFRASAQNLTADFEPVVDESKALPHDTKAAFVCPMHPEISAQAAGTCRMCGMNLVPNRPPRPAGELHDAGYAMASPVGSRTLAAGQSVPLTFLLEDAQGYRVRDFAVVHTRKLHLIVVSKDLGFFDHIHPKLQSNGAFTLHYAFPAPGEYALFADLTPMGDRNQVFRLPVTVTGTPPAPQPLVVTPAQARLFGDVRVSLTVSPAPLVSKDETYLTFHLAENGTPLTDLEPFLGAGGHCVIISEDTQAYLHSHPAETNAVRYGPNITFHTVFPHPGKYKVWGQFQRQGKPLTADFVVAVN